MIVTISEQIMYLEMGQFSENDHLIITDNVKFVV